MNGSAIAHFGSWPIALFHGNDHFSRLSGEAEVGSQATPPQTRSKMTHLGLQPVSNAVF